MTDKKTKTAAKLQEGGVRIGAAGMQIFNPADINSLSPVEWIIDPLVPCRAVSVLAGRPDVGKSGWLCSAAVAIAAARGEMIGLPGSIKRPGRVGMFGFEDDYRVLVPRLVAAMREWGVSNAAVGERIQLRFDGGKQEILNALPHFDLTVVDTMSQSLAGESENDNALISQLVNQYKQVVAEVPTRRSCLSIICGSCCRGIPRKTTLMTFAARARLPAASAAHSP